MSLSRKERRALQYLRDAAGLPPAKPWAYQKEREARRREAALLADLVMVAAKHRTDLKSVTRALMSVTEGVESP